MTKQARQDISLTNNPIYKSAAGERVVMAHYEAALARWPVPYRERAIATRHGDTHVIISGDDAAPALVLLHGAGTNATIWGADVAAYCAHYAVYAVDLPGEPGKSASNRPPWDGPAFAEWLADVLDGLGCATAALAGISQGGWTALRFATLHPARVPRLALLCPGGIVPDRFRFFVQAGLLSLLGTWGRRRLNRAIFGAQPIPDGVEEIMLAIMRHFKPRMGVLPIFEDAELARLTMPVLLLGGDQDPLRDHARIAARLRAHLPQLDVVILPGAGHALLDTVDHVLPFLTAGAPVTP